MKPSTSCINMVTLVPVLCSLLVLNLVSCEEPSINSVSKDQIKEIGEEAEFNCTASRGIFPVLWLKLDKEGQNGAPLSTNEGLIIQDPKFSLTYYKNESTYSLKVRNLQESDTGFYQCQILITSTQKIFRNVELQIRRPPKIISATVNGNITEGSQIELHCKADGYPVPRVFWKRENDDLLSIGGSVYNGEVLKIPKSHRDDRGLYMCIADNGVGKQVHANVTVVIEFSPIVTAVRPRVGQAQGYDANLECNIEAHPAPIITWLRNGNELRKDDSLKKDNEFLDFYTVYSVESSDYGEYVCKAENKLGESETKIELFATQVPVCVSTCG